MKKVKQSEELEQDRNFYDFWFRNRANSQSVVVIYILQEHN